MPRERKKTEPVGERLQRLRKQKGLTQAQLGERIGVSQRVVTYYEAAGGSLSPELLVKIADALDVSADELLGRKPSSKRPTPPTPESLRRWRRLKRVEELPPHDQKAVLKMIDAMANEALRRRTS
jgi:transcriptional regulator with XRE-family HTH domain